MKSIKKISLFVVAAILSISFANAQVGVQAGFSSSMDSRGGSAMNGAHVGLTASLDIQGPISLEYALLYNYLTKSNDVLALVETTTTAHRFDVPFRLNAGFPIADNVILSIFGGPNFNFGVSQTTKAKTPIANFDGSNIYNQKVNGKAVYSPFDLQMGGGIGLNFGTIGVRASYDYGLLNRVNSDNETWKNNDFKVGLVYQF